ncbi:hypothetical protein MPTK1_6g04980 [Marchantia polymorpha subsp. ruderalis]|uniref:Uncharacterized protein n=2 Tax=Marchantia polymorpha TaxID=3197 RepID=A0AAF6BNN3_MARPO|nr:hypothetical protein MARPO_0034s0020 [Marchantia polymorpha]BBN13617.1 hypothetical protein Mp_6g04980 [Marchantia polymorpha subsp. ruderalis]|eukprot:PTQ41412.1 hypothetical protein MARPO_0034s0020 [Marchantia polymorpha]
MRCAGFDPPIYHIIIPPNLRSQGLLTTRPYLDSMRSESTREYKTGGRWKEGREQQGSCRNWQLTAIVYARGAAVCHKQKTRYSILRIRYLFIRKRRCTLYAVCLQQGQKIRKYVPVKKQKGELGQAGRQAGKKNQGSCRKPNPEGS